MADPAEKGKFSTDIGQDLIDQALQSVKRAATPEVKPGAAAPAEGSEVPIEMESSDASSADGGEELAPSAEPAAPSPPSESREVTELKAQLELSLAKGREMMDKIRDSHEKMLRAVADLENFKKRAQKEKEEVQRFGSEKLLKDFLPVVDNLDRALEHAKTSSDFEGLRQGVQMTRKLFDDALGKNGVRSFSAVGKPFDPRMHEAMQQLETSEMPPNHVAAEVLRGYMLSDRLVRPALVMVSKAKEAPAAPAEPAPSAPAAEGSTDASGGTGQKS